MQGVTLTGSFKLSLRCCLLRRHCNCWRPWSSTVPRGWWTTPGTTSSAFDCSRISSSTTSRAKIWGSWVRTSCTGAGTGPAPRAALNRSTSLPATVREKAKDLVSLLNDTERIRDEREKARKLASKMVGVGSDTVRTGGGRREFPRASYNA